ncbi:MAG: peptidylprolyl isomerase [Actinobacteria bacterium]|nr:peptidylprolyl isomerase [Actinomycetota bacterium]
MLLAVLVLSSCASTTSAGAGSARTTGAGLASSSPGTVSCTYVTASTPVKPVDPPSGRNVPATGTAVVVLTTNAGPVTITMDRAKTPCTVNSFLSLAQQRYFDATSCHRLVNAGMYLLQCGDPSGTGMGGPGYTFRDETYATDSFPAGTVAMANAGPNTNGSQFFLVYADTPLPPQYTVFGHMDAAGTKVVAAIAADGQDSSNQAGGGKPNNPAKILSVTLG